MVTRFGAYEILYELKSGGMGDVLLGRRRGPGAFEQLVAIKTIRAEYAHAPQVRAMFLDEAAILARLNHPGVATVHDFGEENATLYMVMEYVAGISFRDFAELRPPPMIMARAIAEAARGLDAAHELHDLSGQPLGVVHRDISPDNLMLGFDGHVKVIDFGIALVKNRQSPVTEFGTMKGKPPYMSPEQIANEAMDHRSDVFSLGVVLHEMLTGAPLFDGDSIYAIALAVQQKQIPPPSQLRGEPLPLGLDAVVMNALDRDPARRTQSAALLSEALDQVIQQVGDETLPAWAARALAGPRDEHRAWLARVVAGMETASRPGRATSQQTQVAGSPGASAGAANLAVGGTSAGTVATPPSSEPAMSTHLPAVQVAGDLDQLDLPVRRTNRTPFVLALLLLLSIGLAVFVVMRTHATAPGVIDASITLPLGDAAPGDAASLPAPVDAVARPTDALVIFAPLDAGGHTTQRDAGMHVRPDAAAPPHAPPDAAVEVAPPSGSGFITITHRAGGAYLNIVVDGKQLGTTPMIHHRLPAGTHLVELIDPKTSETVKKTTVLVEDGGTAKVAE